MAEAKKKATKATKKTTKKVEVKPVEVKETKKESKVAPKVAEKLKYKIKKNHISTVGRRKTAAASLFLYKEKGEILVNHMDINDYFPSPKEKLAWMAPFHAVGISHPTSKFNATIKVVGSGKSGQLGAVAHAISRALATMSDENQSILRQAGFLTRDPRMVERKKYFFKKARKKPQYSKR